MKIRIQALSEELNISENTLIHWLTRKGYSGARSQDWLTPQLAQRARRELGAREMRVYDQWTQREVRLTETSMTSRTSKTSKASKISKEEERDQSDARFASALLLPPSLVNLPIPESQTQVNAQVSSPSLEHATLIETHTHTQQHLIPLSRITRQTDQILPPHPLHTESDLNSEPHLGLELLARVINPSQTRPEEFEEENTVVQAHQTYSDDALKRERARGEMLIARLEEQRTHYEARYEELQRRYERTMSERTQLRQSLYSMNQDQATLDQTCKELTQELDQTREEVESLKRSQRAQQQISSAIHQEKQQKLAWRARALALEERVQTNQQLSAQLKGLGLESLELQTRLFQTLLSTPESASHLFNAIKMVEQDELKAMVKQWVVQTCHHPLCDQINRLSHHLSLRVDRAHHCQVCHGDSELRWFQRLIVSCERSHVKRFLLVGAECLHDRIRAFTEGRSVNFRLISSDDQSSDQRITSRLENSDLLVIWPHEEGNHSAHLHYRKVAEQIQTPLLELPGSQPDLILLARRSLNWVMRTGGSSSA